MQLCFRGQEVLGSAMVVWQWAKEMEVGWTTRVRVTGRAVARI